MAEHAQSSAAQVRPLSPPLMRPMAVAHREMPSAGPALRAVLEVLAEFAD